MPPFYSGKPTRARTCCGDLLPPPPHASIRRGDIKNHVVTVLPCDADGKLMRERCIQERTRAPGQARKQVLSSVSLLDSDLLSADKHGGRPSLRVTPSSAVATTRAC